MSLKAKKKRLPYTLLTVRFLYPEEQSMTTYRQSPISLMLGHKKCPILIEQLTDARRDIKVYRTVSTAKMGKNFYNAKDWIA